MFRSESYVEKAKMSMKNGFTLLEVVIALAVFGFLIGGLLGFLPWGRGSRQEIRILRTSRSMPFRLNLREWDLVLWRGAPREYEGISSLPLKISKR